MSNERKKIFVELPKVKKFIEGQSEAVRDEYDLIVDELERDGTLSMPKAEKIAGENLFAIRVIRAGNVRVFYVYGLGKYVYAISGYVKKTRQIPDAEMELARRIVKLLKQEKMIK